MNDNTSGKHARSSRHTQPNPPAVRDPPLHTTPTTTTDPPDRPSPPQHTGFPPALLPFMQPTSSLSGQAQAQQQQQQPAQLPNEMHLLQALFSGSPGTAPPSYDPAVLQHLSMAIALSQLSNTNNPHPHLSLPPHSNTGGRSPAGESYSPLPSLQTQQQQRLQSPSPTTPFDLPALLAQQLTATQQIPQLSFNPHSLLDPASLPSLWQALGGQSLNPGHSSQDFSGLNQGPTGVARQQQQQQQQRSNAFQQGSSSGSGAFRLPSPPENSSVPPPSGATAAPGDSPTSASPDPDDVNTTDDKRRRNTLASSRFRLKKKQRMLNLERSVSDLTGRAEELEREATELRRENGWLKEILMMKARTNFGNRRLADGERSGKAIGSQEEEVGEDEGDGDEEGDSDTEEREPPLPEYQGKGKGRQQP